MQSSWLEQLLKQTREAESPKTFFYWSGLSAISAVVRNNVWLDKFYYKLAPNIFVMLIAKSGGRKGIPPAIAKKLVQEVGNTRIISGRNSVQAIIKDLATAKTTPNGGPPMLDASGFLVSGEFSSFLIQDPQGLTILTDLYDAHFNQEWKNTLKGTGVESLKNVYLTMLTAANPAHFSDAINNVAIMGGFVGRTLLVVSNEKNAINPLTRAPKVKFDIPSLVPYLREIAKVKGEFAYTTEAMEAYEKWYAGHRKQLDNPDLHEDKTGTTDRIHDHILKVAMLLSLARSPELVLELDDIDQAIDACMTSTSSVKQITAGGAGSDSSEMAKKAREVLRALLSAPGYRLKRSRLLRKLWGVLQARELDEILDTLDQQEAIIVSNGMYQLTEDFVKQFTAYSKGDS